MIKPILSYTEKELGSPIKGLGKPCTHPDKNDTGNQVFG